MASARMPTLQVPIAWMGDAQFMNFLRQATAMMGAMNVKFTQQQAAITSNTAAVSRGVGAFYVYHKALQLTTTFMREGISAAAEQETALLRLTNAMNLTGNQTQRLRRDAENLSDSLGRISSTDTLNMFLALSQMGGGERLANVRGVAKTFAAAVDAISIQGGGSPQDITRLMGQFLGAAGGVTDQDRASRALRAMSAGITAFAPQDPQRLVQTLLPAMSTERFRNIPIEDIIAMGILNLKLPTSGLKGGGRNVVNLLEDIMKLEAGPAGRSGLKKFAQHQSAARSLGLMGLPEGEGFWSALMGKLGGLPHTAQTDKLLREVFGENLGRRLARGLMLEPGLFDMIAARMRGMRSPEDIAFSGRRTTAGAFETLKSDMQTLLARIWMPANRRVITPGLGVGVDLATRITRSMQGGAGTAGLTLGAEGITGGLSLAVLGRILGMMLPGSMAGIAATGGTAGLVAAGIGVTIIAGVEAYRNSSTFHQAVDSVAGTVEEMWRRIRATALGLGLIGHSNARMSDLGDPWTSMMVGPQREVGPGGAFDATATAPATRRRSITHAITRHEMGQYIADELAKSMRSQYVAGQTGSPAAVSVGGFGRP